MSVKFDFYSFLRKSREVETSSELISKQLPKVFLIPHIFDKFIEKVDIENKKIFVKNAFDILENS